ncbi:MAG: (d)CMP kinase [Candidatus Edwardsbacteria bacterium]|nr:(d)CMP kinase [Candidatus Edwardsbacteria bacterium]
MSRKLVIAIDGPAASGKSTTARLVAQKLEYLYIDTGAMYRAMGLKALRNNIPFSDITGIAEMAGNTAIRQVQSADGAATYLDGEDVSAAIRQPEISQAASDVSKISAVRRRLVKLQQEMERDGGVVMEGRDITTKVFPNADIKVFMQASIGARARRRQAELAARGIAASVTELEKLIAARDKQDSERSDSPLTCAPDSIVIDTTGLTIEQQVGKVVALAEAKTKGRG